MSNTFRLELKDKGLIEKLKSCVAGKTESLTLKVHIKKRQEEMQHKNEQAEDRWSPQAEALREKTKPTEPSLTLEGTVEGVGDYDAPKKAKAKAKEAPKMSPGAKALMPRTAAY